MENIPQPLPISERFLIGETDLAHLYGFKQGSKEWLESRNMAIGGTRIGALIGQSKYSTPAQAVMGMISEVPLRPTKAIARGTVGEEIIRKELSKQLGITIREVGIAVSKEHPWMRASPDGIYSLPNGGLGIVEIKIFSSPARAAPLMDWMQKMRKGESCAPQIPPEHFHQMQYTAGVIGATEITYCALIWPTYGCGPETGGLIVHRFDADSALYQDVYVPYARAALYARNMALSDAPQNGDSTSN